MWIASIVKVLLYMVSSLLCSRKSFENSILKTCETEEMEAYLNGDTFRRMSEVLKTKLFKGKGTSASVGCATL